MQPAACGLMRVPHLWLTVWVAQTRVQHRWHWWAWLFLANNIHANITFTLQWCTWLNFYRRWNEEGACLQCINSMQEHHHEAKITKLFCLITCPLAMFSREPLPDKYSWFYWSLHMSTVQSVGNQGLCTPARQFFAWQSLVCTLPLEKFSEVVVGPDLYAGLSFPKQQAAFSKWLRAFKGG